MNLKQAKKLRKLLKLKLPIEPKWDYLKSQKVNYFQAEDGTMRPQLLEKVTMVNTAKFEYKKLKKAWKNRERK